VVYNNGRIEEGWQMGLKKVVGVVARVAGMRGLQNRRLWCIIIDGLRKDSRWDGR
jgi:hypothetical protein